MKWNSDNISKFLQIYETYPLLWNFKLKDCMKANVRKCLFTQLMEELEYEGLLRGMNDKQLKAKIKSIKDVYRQELCKIERSKKNEGDEIYIPKLVWFNKADFMRDVISTKESQYSKIDMSKNDIESTSESEMWSESGKDTTTLVSSTPHRILPKQIKNSTITVTPSLPSVVEKVSKKLNQVIEKLDNEDAFEKFGKYVAAELRQLPKRPAILLQLEIQNTIAQAKLSRLEQEVAIDPIFVNITNDSPSAQSPSEEPSVTQETS
ncbi:hypothetical protein C0J52_14093 [Blattella germanica]|nr:hypothetical protein C0J52_14093 [Blattella germanica]